MLLDEYPSVGMLHPAIVISVAEKQARVYVKGRGSPRSNGPACRGPSGAPSELALGPDPKTAGEILARGDIVYVVREKG